MSYDHARPQATQLRNPLRAVAGAEQAVESQMDGRPQLAVQRQRQMMIASSGRVTQHAALADRINGSARMASGRQQAAQLQKVVPAVTGAANLTATATAAYTDPVTPGPVSEDKYEYDIAATAPTRMAALAAIRTEYTAAGTGTQGGGKLGFLSHPRINALIGANRPVLDEARIAARTVDPTLSVTATAEEVRPHLTNAAVLDALRDNDNIPQVVDPFQMLVTAPYTVPGAANAALTNKIEFTEGQKGYITRVADTGKGVESSLADRPNLAGQFPEGRDDQQYKGTGKTIGEARDVARTIGATTGNTGTYSNIHHADARLTAGEQIDGIQNTASRQINEAGIDAYTKLVAEGGRWNCVAGLGLDLVDDSQFFTQHRGTYYGVDFKTLWGNWTAFGTAYGIPNITVAQKISGQGRGGVPGWATELSGKPSGRHHYDLDTGGRGMPIPPLRGALRSLNGPMTAKETEAMAVLSALHRNMGW